MSPNYSCKRTYTYFINNKQLDECSNITKVLSVLGMFLYITLFQSAIGLRRPGLSIKLSSHKRVNNSDAGQLAYP